MVTSNTFAPLDFDHCKNSPQANDVIRRLIWGGSGGITILDLGEIDSYLFSEVAVEARATLEKPGQEFDGSHPTFQYVSKQDRSWTPKDGTVRQYSLYNSKDDFIFNGDDHHWSAAKRRFNSALTCIPRFVSRYFRESELQNFRLQSLTKEGGLGKHREKIIGIPGREDHYKLRFHLPIVTNPGVLFYMDGQEHRMEVGRMYLFNQSCLHGVHNSGEALRAHLVWDAYLNEHIISTLIAPSLQHIK